MSSAVTDQTICNELQYTLLETANSGASYGSSLYTTTEVAARLNYRANLFNMLTGTITSFGSQVATSGSKAQDLTTGFSTMIDIVDVHYTPDTGTTYYNIPGGSSLEADEYISTQTAVSVPSIYTIDSSKLLQLNLFPAPTFTGTAGQIYLFWTPNIGLFPSTPNGTQFTTGFPDDFTPFIKYGVLADLFNKSGETYDPLRASICEGLFSLGVEMARSWISGTPSAPVQVQQPYIAPING